MGKLQITFRDGQISPSQTSSVGIPIQDLTGDITTPLAQLALFADAIQGITLGHRLREAYVAKVDEHIDVPAGHADAEADSETTARRESKWLVRYHDDLTGEPGTLTIPCADLALLDTVTRSKLDISNPPGSTFKTFFENWAMGPGGGGTVLDEVVFVGRNT